MKDDSFVCDGCSIREPWEHRCTSGNCKCAPCEEGRRTLTPEREAEYRARLTKKDRALTVFVFVPAEVERCFAEIDRLRAEIADLKRKERVDEHPQRLRHDN